MRVKEKLAIVAAVWKISVPAVIKKPVIIFPLAILALIKGGALGLMYYYPRAPLRNLVEPIFVYFNRAHYLRYPANFLFITKLTGYVYPFIYVIFGSLLAGWAFCLAASYVSEGKINLREAFRDTFRRYLTLLIFVGVIYVLAYGFFSLKAEALGRYFAGRERLLFLTRENAGLWMVFIDLFFTALINMSFAFAPAAVILEKKGLFKAFVKNFSLLRGIIFPTFILVLAPSLLGIPISILRRQIPVLILKVFPEITVVILGAGIVFVFLIESLVVSAAATLYVLNKEAQ